MLRTSIIAAVSAAVLMFSSTAFAQQASGTADEAKAMLMKAVAAVKTDKTRHGIQVNDHFICSISRRNWVFQLADLRRVLMLPLDLLARRRPSAKRRTTAMFLAPWPAR